MPGPDKPTDPGFNTFELRAGIGATDKWRGIRLQGASSMLRPGDLRQGQNIRPTKDGYTERGGLSKVITTPAASKIDGIFDFGDVGARE